MGAAPASMVTALAPLLPHSIWHFPFLLTCVPLALLFGLHLSSVPGHFLLDTVLSQYFNLVGGLNYRGFRPFYSYISTAKTL